MRSRHFNYRRSHREPVLMSADCRTQTGLFGRIDIVDLTREGCRIFAKGLPLRTGQRVRLRPANFQSIAGIVRWMDMDFAGVEFDNPLYLPVVEHLQRSFAPRNGR